MPIVAPATGTVTRVFNQGVDARLWVRVSSTHSYMSQAFVNPARYGQDTEQTDAPLKYCEAPLRGTLAPLWIVPMCAY